MNSETFTYQLQGFVELSDSDSISDKQWLVIKDHLKLVFDKETPDRSNPTPIKSIDEVLKEIYKQPKTPFLDLGFPGAAPTLTC